MTLGVRGLRIGCALPLALAMLSCHPAPAAAPPAQAALARDVTTAPADTSLYARLGGEAGIRAIASGLGGRIAADGRVNQAFADTDFEVFKLSLAKYLGALCGGPALYKGPDMKTVHSGLGVSNSQFDAVVEDLGAVLAALEVDPVARAELLARLQPLRGEIVGH